MLLSLSALSVVGAFGAAQCPSVGNLWETVWPAQMDPSTQLLLLVDTHMVPGDTLSLDLSLDQQWECATAVVLSNSQYVDFLSEVSAGHTDVGRYHSASWRQSFCGHLRADVPISTWYPSVYHIGLLNLNRETLWVRGSISFTVGHDASLVPLHIPVVLALEALAFLLLVVVGSVLVAADSYYRCCFFYVLGSCVLCKTVSLCSMWHFVTSSPQGSSAGWGRHWVIFLADAHGVLQTTMLMFLSLGWQIVRADLSHIELRVAAVFLGCCLFWCWTMASCDGEVPPLDVTHQHDLNFALMLYFAKVTCCCGSLLSLNIHLQGLAVEILETRVAPSTCRTIAALCMKQKVCTRLRHLFLILFAEMIFLPCIMCVFSYPHGGQWISEAFDSAFQGAFYVVLAWLIMVLPRHPMPLERFFAAV